jgi:hypothetical protein
VLHLRLLLLLLVQQLLEVEMVPLVVELVVLVDGMYKLDQLPQ